MLYINRNAIESAPSTTLIPEGQGVALALDRVVLAGQRVDGGVQRSRRSRGRGVARGEFGDLRTVVQAGLEDAAHHRHVDLARPG